MQLLRAPETSSFSVLFTAGAVPQVILPNLVGLLVGAMLLNALAVMMLRRRVPGVRHLFSTAMFPVFLASGIGVGVASKLIDLGPGAGSALAHALAAPPGAMFASAAFLLVAGLALAAMAWPMQRFAGHQLHPDAAWLGLGLMVLGVMGGIAARSIPAIVPLISINNAINAILVSMASAVVLADVVVVREKEMANHGSV